MSPLSGFGIALLMRRGLPEARGGLIFGGPVLLLASPSNAILNFIQGTDRVAPVPDAIQNEIA